MLCRHSWRSKNLLYSSWMDMNLNIQHSFWITKGGLISEGILNLVRVPLPTKGVKSLPWAESLNFPPFTVNNLIKFSAQGRDFAPFLGNGTKVKIASEIKPPFEYGLLWKMQRNNWICSTNFISTNFILLIFNINT